MAVVGAQEEHGVVLVGPCGRVHRDLGQLEPAEGGQRVRGAGAAASVHVLVVVLWICCRPQEAWADAELIVRRFGPPSITPSALASSVAYIL